ncbi:DUF3426 domain-containing protein [Pandoraea sp. B-6]|uniref:DUF3426 domain-containing protein n=1 Tax=Pandoraea sp. B-6 TaxID=1204340 RepID=UPI000A012F4A|nr:DUF3426 domain-containing protein [Pandoraea sp. B-6]
MPSTPMAQSSRVLATRCPHCHTVFRVVADQLKLRDGLVRCGNCREVFDGHAYLCEPPGEEHEAEAAPAERPPVPEMLTPTAIAALLGTPDESLAQMRHGPGRYIDDDDATVLVAPTASMTSSASVASADSPTSVALAGQARRPGVGRVIWRALIALAVVGLIAQWAWVERAALVDRVPALRGVFATLGRPMHVPIAPPRQPDKVQISSVTLVTDAPGTTDASDASDATSGTPASAPASDDAVPMTLTVFMRNQADYAVAWPSLELTLSDIDGKPVVRRVFSASDYVTDTAQHDAGLAPHNERTIRLRLTAQAALASNYRVLAFYP